MSARTARRRRIQATNGYRHLAKLGRPIYRKKSSDKLNRKAAKAAEIRKQMQARGKG